MILVTGATGLIGQAIVLRLLSEGLSVRAAVRSLAVAEKNFAEQLPIGPNLLDIKECDVSTLTEESAKRLFEDCEAVVHCAALVHKASAPDLLYDQINIAGTGTLAQGAKQAGVEQFIFISSSSVYGNRETVGIEEESELIADTAYARSKIASEEMLKSMQVAKSTVIVRPSMVFGAGDRGNMLSLIRQILSGKYFLIGKGNAQKSLMYSEDFATAVLHILRKKNAGISTYNLANPEPVSIKTLSESILKAAGLKRPLLAVPEIFTRTLCSAVNPLLKERSPLSPDRLSKLLRTNTISTEKFQRDYDFVPQFALQDALQKEISWARYSQLI